MESEKVVTHKQKRKKKEREFCQKQRGKFVKTKIFSAEKNRNRRETAKTDQTALITKRKKEKPT